MVRTSSSVSSIVPSFLADQGDEANAAQLFLLEASVLLLGYFYQLLDPTRLAQRHHDAPAGGKLLHQRTRNVTSAGRGEDRVEGRAVGPAFRSVALDDRDIVVAGPLQPLARYFDQLMLALDADRLARDPADHRRGIARARPDLEHRIAWLDRR